MAAEAATAITLQKIDAANAAMSMKIDVMREDVAAKVAESGEKIDALKRETNVKLCKIDSRLQEAEEAAENQGGSYRGERCTRGSVCEARGGDEANAIKNRGSARRGGAMQDPHRRL